MRNTPSGIGGVPSTPRVGSTVVSPVSGPQQMRGPKEAYFPQYQDQGKAVNYEGRSSRNSSSK